MSVAAYPDYKDSGVEWLGPVPSTWQVARLKQAGILQGGAGFPPELQGLVGQELPFFKVGDLSASEDGVTMGAGNHSISRKTAGDLRAKVIPIGSIIYAKIGAALLLNRRRITNVECCIDNNLTAYTPLAKLLRVRWALYWLGIIDFGKVVNPGAVPSLSEGDQSVLPILIPPIAEQDTIVEFLDRETGKIDALVAEQERLMALLEEKRQAVISHAVTKGLNPDALMKDSGVAWLGQVPAHWKVQRGRHLFAERDDRSEAGDEILLTVSHLTGVTPRSEKTVYMFEAETTEGYKRCLPGDLVINTLWAWMGAMGVAKVEGIVSPAYHVYTPRVVLDSSYTNAIVRMPEFAREASRWSKGVWSSRLRLYPEEMFQIEFPVPPLDEQRAIAGRLEVAIDQGDALTAEAERAIALLRERRAALVSAAVTGKINVLDVATAQKAAA